VFVRCAPPLMCITQHAKKNLKDKADRLVTTGSKGLLGLARHSVDDGVLYGTSMSSAFVFPGAERMTLRLSWSPQREKRSHSSERIPCVA